MGGHRTSTSELKSRTNPAHHRKRQLFLTTAHSTTKRPAYIVAPGIHRPSGTENVTPILQARLSVLQIAHKHMRPTLHIRNEPSCLRVVARQLQGTVPTHVAGAHVYKRRRILRESQAQSALVSGRGQLPILDGVPPQILPPR